MAIVVESDAVPDDGCYRFFLEVNKGIAFLHCSFLPFDFPLVVPEGNAPLLLEIDPKKQRAKWSRYIDGRSDTAQDAGAPEQD